MTPSSSPTVGVVGLGAMGSAMASHLIAAGISVVGNDIDDGRCVTAGNFGVRIMDLSEVGRSAHIIITSMPSFAAAMSVLRHDSPLVNSLTSDSIVIETSTLALDEKQQLADQVRMASGTLLDCPMSGTAHQARNADLVAYLSGDPGAKRQAWSILEPFTRSIRDLGEFGNGTLTKLIANHLVAVHNVAAAEALGIAAAAGMDTRLVLDAVSDGAGNSRMLEIRGPLMIDEDYVPAGMRVDLFMKDLTLICNLSDDVDAPSPLLNVALDVYRRALEQGRQAQDTACAFSVLRNFQTDADPATGGA